MAGMPHQIDGITVVMHEAPEAGTYLITINERYLTKITFSRDNGPRRWTCGCGQQARNREAILTHVVRAHHQRPHS
jgi:hypothetical protein